MKKFLSIILFCSVIVTAGLTHAEDVLRRGLFVTVIQDPPVLSGREDIIGLVEFARKADIKILFVQIYRANQAWFPSDIGDPAPYYECEKKVGEDPFALLIKEAHKYGIEVHAWLNMLSLSRNERARLLKKYGPDILTTNRNIKWRISDYRIDNQYFLEPGDPRLGEDLSRMVGEIVDRYRDLDGIQFDYIRYPDMNPAYGYTKINMARFKLVTGNKNIIEGSEVWNNWKRDQVTGLLEKLIQSARFIRPDIKVSTTGLMSYSRAYNEGFQSWRQWLNSGLVDFVTLMCYTKSDHEFKRYLSDARKDVVKFDKVYIAIGAYDMVSDPGEFAEQFKSAENLPCAGAVIFHYGSLLKSPDLISPLMNYQNAEILKEGPLK